MPYCDPEKQRRYQREWQARRRAEWLADKACVRCRSTDDLEIDHIDRAAKVSHRIWSWSTARREVELAKCQVLCGTCHQTKTTEECYGDLSAHGRHAVYVHDGCRCDECRAAHAAQNRRWRNNMSS
jgi:hypothetical protein